MTIHVVKPGETVTSIAAGYGVDPARLAADNSVDREAAGRGPDAGGPLSPADTRRTAR